MSDDDLKAEDDLRYQRMPIAMLQHRAADGDEAAQRALEEGTARIADAMRPIVDFSEAFNIGPVEGRDVFARLLDAASALAPLDSAADNLAAADEASRGHLELRTVEREFPEIEISNPIPNRLASMDERLSEVAGAMVDLLRVMRAAAEQAAADREEARHHRRVSTIWAASAAVLAALAITLQYGGDALRLVGLS